MIEFLLHAKFEAELKALFKKQKNTGDIGFENLKNLLSRQFDSAKPELVIGNSKIHRLSEFSVGTSSLWKVEMNVKGLRPSQWPRIWFLLNTDKIYFLLLATHQENYDNKFSTKEAASRATEF